MSKFVNYPNINFFKKFDFEYINGLYIFLTGKIYELEGKSLKNINYKETIFLITSFFQKYREKLFDALEGSFAIFIFDPSKERLYISSDRIGLKKIYYGFDGQNFVFSLKLKDIFKDLKIGKEIDKNALALYIRYGYISEPYTIFKKIRKLRSGFYLRFDLKSRKLQEKPYWRISDFYFKKSLDLSEEEILLNIEKLLIESIEKRIEDKNQIYASFLSGGYDSTIVTLFLQKVLDKRIETFTLGFHEKSFNEAIEAKRIAAFLDTSHNEVYFSSKEAKEIFPKLSLVYEEPFSDKAALGMLFLSEFVSKKSLNIFSGEGGDEIFGLGGEYPIFNRLNFVPKFIKDYLSFFMGKVSLELLERGNFVYNFSTRFLKWKDILSGRDVADFIKYREQILVFKEIESLFKEEVKELDVYKDKEFFLIKDEFAKMLSVYFEIYLKNDEIVKISKIADFENINLYEPILDKNLMEFVARVDSKLKNKNHIFKYLAKALCEKYIPKELMERPKRGLSIPINRWLREDLRDYLEYYLNSYRIKEEGIFNTKKVLEYKEMFLKGKDEYTKRVWVLLIFESWYEKNFKEI